MRPEAVGTFSVGIDAKRPPAGCLTEVASSDLDSFHFRGSALRNASIVPTQPSGPTYYVVGVVGDVGIHCLARPHYHCCLLGYTVLF
jgi:hypothetical protein